MLLALVVSLNQFTQRCHQQVPIWRLVFSFASTSVGFSVPTSIIVGVPVLSLTLTGTPLKMLKESISGELQWLWFLFFMVLEAEHFSSILNKALCVTDCVISWPFRLTSHIMVTKVMRYYLKLQHSNANSSLGVVSFITTIYKTNHSNQQAVCSCICLFFILGWCWGYNPEPCTCETSTLLLS